MRRLTARARRLWRAVTKGGPQRWYVLLASVGVLAVLSTCGVFSYLLIQDELAGQNAQADTGDVEETVPRDISSRDVDPEPLTVDEVFGEDEIVITESEPPYEVLATQETECSEAAEDELVTLLADLGCSQVVRATLRSPEEGYLITSGIANLATAEDAEEAYEGIKPLIEDGTGRFLGMHAGEGTDPIILSETVLFWDIRGHYLMYAVIARSDGGEFSASDNQRADLLSWDLIEVYLRSGILEQRATAPNPELASEPPPAEDEATPDEPE